MTTWSSGYLTELAYTPGYYRELSPAQLRLVALANGAAAPEPGGGDFAYCELGCGQGVSANLLASANPGIAFHAVDFNPAHIAGAEHLARDAGTPNVRFHDRSFAEFADMPGLPRGFDIIALHGVWSWVGEEQRREILRFVRDRLKPGGLFYLSYNAMPGWAASVPLRRLLSERAASRGSGPITARIEESLGFLRRLQESGAKYFAANPGIADRLTQIQGQDRAYLAHEFCNETWTPLFFADVARDLAGARLTYLGSAYLIDFVDALNLTADQQRLLAEIGDPVLRETVRDHILNQQFRRDVFVRGPVRLGMAEVRDRWLAQRFALLAPSAEVPRKVNAPVGEAALQPEVYEPLLAALDRGPCSVAALLSDPALAAVGLQRVAEALVVLVGLGVCDPALPDAGEAERRARTDRFNDAVLARTADGAELRHLASPVTGAGIAADGLEQTLIRLARHRGTGGEDVPRLLAQALREQGRRIVKDGRVLETDQDILTEIRARIAAFDSRLPVLARLQVGAVAASG